jgi:hypothetical protein
MGLNTIVVDSARHKDLLEILNDFVDLKQHSDLLMAAAHAESPDALRWLIAQGLPVNVDTPDGPFCPALVIAALDRRTENARVLLEAGANHEPRPGRDSALGYAISTRNRELVELLRSHGAIMDPEILAARDEAGMPAENLRAFLDKWFGTVKVSSETDGISILRVDADGMELVVTDGLGRELIGDTLAPELRARCELALFLPKGWVAATDRTGRWADRCLTQAACAIRAAGARERFEQLAEIDPGPLWKGSKFDSLLLIRTVEALTVLALPDGTDLYLLTVQPLYPSERRLVQEQGAGALLSQVNTNVFTRVVNLKRPPAV